MEKKTLTFAKPKDITRPGYDGVLYEFPFSAVDSDLIGLPEELRVTTTHCLTVECTRSRLRAWNLSVADLQKVLFGIGKRQLLQRAPARGLKDTEAVSVHTLTHSATPPFDPSRIPDPNGVEVTIELAGPRIGF